MRGIKFNLHSFAPADGGGTELVFPEETGSDGNKKKKDKKEMQIC